ncbi:hypothetical protein [Sulfitobacter sp. JB4-11]|uniref:hypothetical protein n=1 Tax=Sulfitobacter rhodophyticola TaxID=3238304 RepID=UPI003D81BA79
MNRPKTQLPRRPRMASAKVARSAKEAAIGLVRLEFDAARLRQGLDQAQNRAESFQHELQRNCDERKHLMTVLAQAEAVAENGLAR